MLVKYMDACEVKELLFKIVRSFGACEVDWMFVKYMDLCEVNQNYF